MEPEPGDPSMACVSHQLGAWPRDKVARTQGLPPAPYLLAKPASQLPKHNWSAGPGASKSPAADTVISVL